MLAVIQDRKVYFPEYMVSTHNQGFKTSRDRYYRNFIFIAFNEIGNLALLHNMFKNFRAPIIQTRDMILGLNIDVMGSVNLIRVATTVKKGDSESSTEIVSTPFITAVDLPTNDEEWNVIAEYPAMHDYCAALLHHGVKVPDAIAKTLSAMGHPNGNKISSIAIKDAVKELEGTYVYDKNLKEDSEGVLLDLIKGSIKSLK